MGLNYGDLGMGSHATWHGTPDIRVRAVDSSLDRTGSIQPPTKLHKQSTSQRGTFNRNSFYYFCRVSLCVWFTYMDMYGIAHALIK